MNSFRGCRARVESSGGITVAVAVADAVAVAVAVAVADAITPAVADAIAVEPSGIDVALVPKR